MRLQSHRLVTRRVDPLVMKSLNAIEVLELVRTRGPISRASLAASSQLSKPTVSDQVDSLISRELVIEVGTGNASSRGGKKPTLVEFNASYGQVFCADIGAESIRFAAFDLSGRHLGRDVLPTRPDRGTRSVVRTVRQGIAGLIEAASDSHLRVISVAVPGIVDVRQGMVLETDNVFGWRDLRLGPELSSHFGIPVCVDNDVNMAALAERNSGTAPDNFVLVRLDTGIGAAVVLNGRLHHGAHWAAGEIGHMALNVNAIDEAADPRGYLESVVGRDRVEASIRRAARESGKAAAERQVMSDVALHMGSAIANIAAMYDPDAVILLGEAFLPIVDQIRRISSRVVRWPVEVRVSQLGEDAALHGALAAGLEHAYAEIAQSLHSEATEKAASA